MNTPLPMFTAMFLLVGAPSAWASAYSCTGTIDFIGLAPSGVVTVKSSQSGLMGFYVCQIGVSTNGVGPDTCKAMLAQLLAAHTARTAVTWQFNDSIGCNRSDFNGGNWYWLNTTVGGVSSVWTYGPQS